MVHHYTPETKRQSKPWAGTGENAPHRAKEKSWLLIDYLEIGWTITEAYYASPLDKLKVLFIHIWPKWKWSFTRTTRLHKRLGLLLLNYMTYASSKRLMRFLASTLFFQTYRNVSLDEDLLQMMRSKLRQKFILQSWTNGLRVLTSCKVGLNVLNCKETVVWFLC